MKKTLGISLAVTVTLAVIVYATIFAKRPNGVGTILGLKMGTSINDLKVKEGPNDPPMLARSHNPYFELEHPNMEFSRVGVSTTINNEESKKEGMLFLKEGIVWGAVFIDEKCDKARYEKTKKFVIKNWNAKVIHEDQRDDSSNLSLSSVLISSRARWEILCFEGTHSLVVSDFGVIGDSLDEPSRLKFEKLVAEQLEALDRRM